MKERLWSIVNIIIKTVLTLCIVPLVMIGMLPLSLFRLVYCLVFLVFKPRRMQATFNRGLTVSQEPTT